MAEQFILTFAELGFLLRAHPDQAAEVRRHLGINPDAASDVVSAAGVASLLARRLCTLSGTDVVPGERAVAATAGLVTSRTHTEAIGFAGGKSTVLHLFSGPAVRVALFAAAYGQFVVELLRPDEPLAEPVVRFLDECVEAGPGPAVEGAPGGVAVAIRSTSGDDEVSLAIAVEGDGTWYLSDSLASPDQGVPSTRDAVVRRIADLLGAQQVGARD